MIWCYAELTAGLMLAATVDFEHVPQQSFLTQGIFLIVCSFPVTLRVFVLQEETRSTCGSSWWSCCRTDRFVPATSNGLIRRPGSSSWSTQKPWRGSGANTKTNQIWTMRQWEEHSGTTAFQWEVTLSDIFWSALWLKAKKTDLGPAS